MWIPSGQDGINFAAYFLFRQLPSVSMDIQYIKGKCFLKMSSFVVFDKREGFNCPSAKVQRLLPAQSEEKKAWILPWIFSYSNGKHKQGKENRKSEEKRKGVFSAYNTVPPIAMRTEDLRICCFLLSNVISSDARECTRFCSFLKKNNKM